jgi:uncharacterized protein with gpF-like domain
MRKLQTIIENLLKRVKATLEINAGLENVMRKKEYRKVISYLDSKMNEQVRELLESEVLQDIDNAIGKADRIWTESDDLEIQDAVNNNLKPLKEKVKETFAVFLIWVFNQGGQDFLNKHNIPKEFNLKNPKLIMAANGHADMVLSGVDKTTSDWVSRQIIKGKQAGLSNSDIADNIRGQIPDTYANRAETIVRTETSRMVGQAEQTTAVNNGASHKYWVTAGADVCDDCASNEDVGVIGIDAIFPTGDSQEPAHPNCRCLVEYQFTPFMGNIWSGE